ALIVIERETGLQDLIDTAHQLGIGVMLDVVFNHFGPDGNFLRAFSDDYFTHAHVNPWGDANNFDGPHSNEMRQLIIDNAVMWVRDYHFDGLRLDATEQIVDGSARFVLAELGEVVRVATDRSVVLVAEEARNLVAVSHPEAAGGWGLDSAWADDFHHSLVVFLTGIQDAWYIDYAGTLSELAGAITSGFIYQGQHSVFQGGKRGTVVTTEPASAFTFCLQNHDQIGNRPFGERLHQHIDRDRYLVASTVLLFVPENLVLFMGQEFLASTPFLFFTDHDAEIGRVVTEGRRNEFERLREFRSEELQNDIPDPQAETTFRASCLDWEERVRHQDVVRLYTDLLHLRKEDAVLAVNDRQRTWADNSGARLLLVRRWTEAGERLLVANFGAATTLPLPLPSAASSEIACLFRTTDPIYGGSDEAIGIAESGAAIVVTMPARSAAIFSIPARITDSDQAM
ncbi:MAG TPA: DUF3459 domain-containing protein, partial [Thermomicrobiales bacterium]|nr:DUF3459 domain-containing protein [Thermomicrobiales bacterium]